MSLIPQGFPALIKKFPLTCQTIGLKFIRADIENHHKRGPRYFNCHGFQNFCRLLKIVLEKVKQIKASGRKKVTEFNAAEAQMVNIYEQLERLGITADT